MSFQIAKAKTTLLKFKILEWADALAQKYHQEDERKNSKHEDTVFYLDCVEKSNHFQEILGKKTEGWRRIKQVVRSLRVQDFWVSVAGSLKLTKCPRSGRPIDVGVTIRIKAILLVVLLRCNLLNESQMHGASSGVCISNINVFHIWMRAISVGARVNQKFAILSCCHRLGFPLSLKGCYENPFCLILSEMKWLGFTG